MRLGLFLPALVFYFLTLSVKYTGGPVVVALGYLNAELIIFALTLAGSLSLVLALIFAAFGARCADTARA